MGNYVCLINAWKYFKFFLNNKEIRNENMFSKEVSVNNKGYVV